MKLHIDTSKPEAVISLKQEGSVLAERQFTADPTLGRQLLEQLDEMLAELGKTKQDITEIDVDPGPGHFMALRSGIVTAQTLAQSLQVKMVPVTPQYQPSTTSDAG